jgi:DNA-binding SARP family transcriptional activator/tetratricopeptide (TPR) repeat protein
VFNGPAIVAVGGHCDGKTGCTTVVKFGILGPLRVLGDDETEVVIGAPRLQVLLASLLVRSGRVVSAETLADYVWDGKPPPGAKATLQSYVMRLRRLLGPGAGTRLQTRPPGYLLDLDMDSELDLRLFERLRHEGQQAAASGQWELAVSAFRSALGLWRGEALADVPSELLRSGECERLGEARMVVIESWAEAELQVGRAHDVVPELSGLCAEHPFRESLHGLLMTALYASGRRAEALSEFVAVRRRLVEEIGVEPGPKLMELHARMLSDDPTLLNGSRSLTPGNQEPKEDGAEIAQRDASAGGGRPRDPSAEIIPRQLPAAIRHFTARAAELETLTTLLPDASEAVGTVVITALRGMGGIGKTALAVYWAHQVTDAFPDGQLYVDLRGFSPETAPLTVAEAVRAFLDAFGVPPSRLPASVEAQCALYRSLVAGKRVLVVLDNARDAAQVRPLLPGAASCLALVTSRNRLTSLAAVEGAQILDLDVFSREDARDLLVRRLGTRWTTAQSAAVDDLIELCSGLPLALSIAAARASGSPERIVAVAEELRHERSRLDALDAGDPVTDVRAVFSWSYRNLDAAAAWTFRMLGLHPGPDISLAAVASLTGYSPPGARRAMASLTQACLVTASPAGRYTLHDLVLAYAGEQAGQLPDTERDAALRRMMDHYLHSGAAASQRLSPRRHQITLGSLAPGVVTDPLADVPQALAWFERETPVLLAVARRAAALGLDVDAWQIPWTAAKFLHQSGRWQDLISIGLTAAAAAGRAGDRDGQADMNGDLGLCYAKLGAFDEAQVHLTRALELYTASGNLPGQSSAHRLLAATCEARGRPREALDHALQSLELSRRSGDPRYEGDALCTVAWFHALCGEFDQSLTRCQESLRWYRANGDPHGEAAVHDTLGYSYHQLGQYDQAIGCYQQALKQFQHAGDRYNVAGTFNRLGDVHAAAGANGAARDAWHQALLIMDNLGHVDAEKVRAKIARFD